MSNNSKYITKYQKENTTQVNVRLSKKYDADIIAWLDSKDAKATYIKQLIREDMQRPTELKLTDEQAIQVGFKATGIKFDKDLDPKKMFIINKHTEIPNKGEVRYISVEDTTVRERMLFDIEQRFIEDPDKKCLWWIQLHHQEYLYLNAKETGKTDPRGQTEIRPYNLQGPFTDSIELILLVSRRRVASRPYDLLLMDCTGLVEKPHYSNLSSEFAQKLDLLAKELCIPVVAAVYP